MTAFGTALAIVRISVDPVAVALGPVRVHWYGIAYAAAFAVAYRCAAVPHLVPRGVERRQVERVVSTCIITGLIGARLYYVLQSDTDYYLNNPLHILALWEGGMAFFGAIIATVLTVLVLSRRLAISAWLLLDAGALFGAVGQPIGRLGNLVNGDILGAPSTLPWATAYTNPHAVLQSGFALCTSVHCTAYQPAAAYEGVATLLILGVLLALRRRRARTGLLGISYVWMYGLSQLIVFFWRAHLPLFHGLAQAQWSGIVAMVVVTPVLLVLWRRSDAARTAPLASTGAQPPAAATA
ncbi:MAG: prolipoprotein diacylglyceryl transferase [Candidatus Dormibacteria bacterium]